MPRKGVCRWRGRNIKRDAVGIPFEWQKLLESKNFVGESGKVFEGEGFASDGGGLAHVFKDGEDVVLGDVVDAGVGKAVDKGFASLVEGSPDDLEHESFVLDSDGIGFVEGKLDNGTVYVGAWNKAIGGNVQDDLGDAVVLNGKGKGTVVFGAGANLHTLCYFFLNHYGDAV